MRTAAFVAFAFWLVIAGVAQAQKVGEPLPDQNGLAVQYDGTHGLNVRMIDHHMQVVFIDAKGLVEQCPFKRVILRLNRPKTHGGDVSLVLRPQPDVPFLSHPRFIEPPYNFQIHILLYPNEEGDEGRISVPSARFQWQN